MQCWNCGHEMIWGCDFSFEDYGLEEEGIVSTHTCPNCDSYCEFYTPLSRKEEEDGR